MDAYFHDDPRIQEWINQIIEHIFTACLLTGVDSDAEIQKGCEIVVKLTTLIQEIPTLKSELLADRVKQLLEQQLPDARVINSLPTFQPTMDRMLREGILKVTDTQIKEEVSHLEFVTDSVIPALATTKLQAKSDALALAEALAQVDALTQAEEQARAVNLVLAEVFAQAEIQAKTDALALADALDQVNALTQAEKQAKSDILVLTELLIQAEMQSKADAQALNDALAQVNALVKAEAQAKADYLALAEALAKAESQAKADAQTFADAFAQAEAQAKADAQALANALTKADEQAKSDALVLATVQTQADAQALTDFIAQAELQAKTRQTDLLKRVLINIFPKGTVYWNKSLMGQTFLAHVEDILICLHDSEYPCNVKKYNKDGWKVLVCSTEDLTFPRRVERKIRQIQRSGLGQ